MNLSKLSRNQIEIQKDRCRKVCKFNSANGKRSMSQFQRHWKSKYHVKESLSLNSASSVSFGATEGQIGFRNDSEEVFYSNVLPQVSANFTERELFTWYNFYGRPIGRKAWRKLTQIISNPKFEAKDVPTEYQIDSLNLKNEENLFKLNTVTVENKKFTFLPIEQMIDGMLQSREFQTESLKLMEN